MLKEKYSVTVGNMVGGGTDEWPRLSSRWWKDITNLEGRGGMNWFNKEVVRKVGDGNKTKFWHEIWRGSMSLFYVESKGGKGGGDLGEQCFG